MAPYYGGNGPLLKVASTTRDEIPEPFRNYKMCSTISKILVVVVPENVVAVLHGLKWGETVRISLGSLTYICPCRGVH